MAGSWVFTAMHHPEMAKIAKGRLPKIRERYIFASMHMKQEKLRKLADNHGTDIRRNRGWHATPYCLKNLPFHPPFAAEFGRTTYIWVILVVVPESLPLNSTEPIDLIVLRFDRRNTISFIHK
jgi:hypothetical protein